MLRNKEKTVTEQYVTVDCKLLNVRHKPDISSGSVRQESEGTKLIKLGSAQGGAWTKVPGGYVMSKFVS